jgi:hypothetical protein
VDGSNNNGCRDKAFGEVGFLNRQVALADNWRLKRGKGDKRRHQLMTGGGGNMRCLLTMAGRDNKRRRLQ